MKETQPLLSDTNPCWVSISSTHQVSVSWLWLDQYMIFINSVRSKPLKLYSVEISGGAKLPADKLKQVILKIFSKV